MPLFDAATPPVRGWVVSVDDAGVAHVDWPGNAHGPVAAECIVQLDARPAEAARLPVLLVFAGDARVPIVAGLLHRRLVRDAAVATVAAPRDAASSPAAGGVAPITVSVDGRSVALHAADRIELRCGDSALVMTADGHVTIRGANVVSRATETNKIRGAAVLIN